MVRLAVERHLYDLEHAGERGHYFDEKKAAAQVDFFPTAICHTKGEWAGKPFNLTDNQAFIVWCLFGWRRADGMRRFRHAYITCARKWGKSEFAAGLGNCGASFDDPLEPGAEVFCAATKEDQAKIVHEVAKQMVRLSPALQTQLKVLAKSIVSQPGALQPSSFFKPIGSDSKTSDGLNIHMAILDEIHEWRGKNHRRLYEKLTTAHGARRQPLIVVITTAGDDESDIWKEIDDLSVKTLEGYREIEPPGDNRFAFIARLDESRTCDCEGIPGCEHCDGSGEIPADDPFDSANWPKANPNYPVTPKHDFLSEQAADAKINPAAKHAFLRYHSNVKVSSRLKAIEAAVWKRCRGEFSTWADADVVAGAWDLGGQDDLSAIGLCARFETGRKDEDDKPIYRYEVDAKAWINTENARDLSREPFCSWVDDGLLVVSPRDMADLRSEVVSECHDNHVVTWAFDPANSRDLAQSVEIDGVQPIKFHQNAGMWTEPLINFLKDVRRGQVRHNGNPLLAWAVDNLIIINASRASNHLCMPDKRNSPDKIDPIVAVIMAYRCASVAPARSRGKLFIY